MAVTLPRFGAIKLLVEILRVLLHEHKLPAAIKGLHQFRPTPPLLGGC